MDEAANIIAIAKNKVQKKREDARLTVRAAQVIQEAEDEQRKVQELERLEKQAAEIKA